MALCYIMKFKTHCNQAGATSASVKLSPGVRTGLHSEMRNLSISKEAQQVEECFLRAQEKSRGNKALLFFIPSFLCCFWICPAIAPTFIEHTEMCTNGLTCLWRENTVHWSKPNHIPKCVSVCACLLACCLMFFIPSILFPCKSILTVFTVLSEDLF